MKRKNSCGCMWLIPTLLEMSYDDDVCVGVSFEVLVDVFQLPFRNMVKNLRKHQNNKVLREIMKSNF